MTTSDTRARDQGTYAPVSPRAAADNGHGGLRPRPEVRQLTVHVRRVVRTAPYESWEIDEEMQAAPDPGLTSRQNLAAMRRLLLAEIESAVAELAAKEKEEA